MSSDITVKEHSKLIKLLRRFLIPSPVVTLLYFFKFGAKISPRAEVEYSPNVTFGADCAIGSFTKLKATDGVFRMGDRGGVATGCFISASSGGIEIGNNFICGPNVSIVASNYITEQLGVHLEDQGHTSKGIRIGSNVWIGSNSTILDGAVIGDDSIVVANSLVNRRYSSGSIIQGNPAKVVFKRRTQT